MATNMSLFPSEAFTPATQFHARQIAVQRGAVSLIEQSNRVGRFVVAVQEAIVATGIAAQARAALGKATRDCSDEVANGLADLRSARIDEAELDEIAGDAQRAVTEVQLQHGSSYQTAKRGYVDARMGRLAYEQAYPTAYMLKAVSLYALIAAVAVGALEIPAGAYLLSQTTSFPGGPFGGAIATATMFIGNLKLARIVGVLGGRQHSSNRRKAWAAFGAFAVFVFALLANFALGCLRAKVPFEPASIGLLVKDPLQFLSAWVLMAMEWGVFAAALGWAIGRERAGDTSHYRRLWEREAEKKIAFERERNNFLGDLDTEAQAHRAGADDLEANAEASLSDATDAYDNIHAQRRTLLENHAAVVSECAAVYRDIYALALSEFHGDVPVAMPDFEREFQRLIPTPVVAVAEMALARRLFKEIRSNGRAVVRKARSVRARIADTRLEALRPIYAA
jgi:hypothetical protein